MTNKNDKIDPFQGIGETPLGTWDMLPGTPPAPAYQDIGDDIYLGKNGRYHLFLL